MSEGNGEELEMVNFISEYKTRCELDIDHLPVIEKTKKEMALKGFGVCLPRCLNSGGGTGLSNFLPMI